MNPFQPRTNFNEEALRELANSIKELGVIFTDYLNGQKARIKLMLALTKTKDLIELHKLFE